VLIEITPYFFMKPSSSTTSLTELTAVVPENECFACLELTHESGAALVEGSKYITCGCRFHVHPTCWNQWIREKKEVSNFDFPFCPICRKTSQHPTPTQITEYSIASTNSFCIYALLAVLVSSMAIVGIFLTSSRM
jgi:hypothetical protein